MTSYVRTHVLPILVVLTLFGCVSAPIPERVVRGNSSNEDSAPKGSAIRRITSSYSTMSLLGAVFRYQESYMSFDYFNQFVDGDTIFEDYVYRIFGSEHTPYRLGDGSVLTVRQGGNELFRLERSFVGLREDGSRWWQTIERAGARTIEYATLVHRFGIPLRIRYRSPEDGRQYERETGLSGQLSAALRATPPEKLEVAVTQDIDGQLERGIRRMFFAPEIVGTEVIAVPAGKFEAVHVRDTAAPDGTQADYWLSPDVPGGILKFVVANSGWTLPLIGTLDAVTEGNTLDFPDGEIELESASTQSGIARR